MSWSDLRPGALVENYGDLLLVIAASDSEAQLLILACGNNVSTNAGLVEIWERGSVGWQRVLRTTTIVVEASSP